MSTPDPSLDTRVDEIADGIHRISTPVPPSASFGGFSFNQFLVVDEEPLLFHTGPRAIFGAVRRAIERVLPVERLRWIALSHYEADECGALNELLRAAPRAAPLCSQVAKLVSVDDFAERPARALADGETITIGSRALTWLDTPHLPHAWECGYLFEPGSATLFCGDLLTQPGAVHAPLTERDVLGPSEAFRRELDYFSHSKNARAHLARLAALRPSTLACMHGSAWHGDGERLLVALADTLERD